MEQLMAMQNTLSASFWNESSGGTDNAVKAILDAGTSAIRNAEGREKEDNDKSKDPILQQMQYGQDLTSEAAKAVIGNICGSSGTDSTEDAQVDERQSRTRATPTVAPRAASKPKASPKSSPTAGKARESRGGVNCPNVRGRPRRDFTTEIGSDMQQFANSTKDDPLWWGSEAKTQLKALHHKESDMKVRIRNSKDMDEVHELHVLIKRLGVAMALVEVVAGHGLGSREFQAVFDLKKSQMALPPAVDVELPKFLTWERHTMSISTDYSSSSKWEQDVSSASLRQFMNGCVVAEQERLYSEKLASSLRIVDDTARGKLLDEIFSVDREYDLEASEYVSKLCRWCCLVFAVLHLQASVKAFVEAMAIILAADDFDELAERVQILTEALAIIDAHVPSKSKGVSGSLLGSTLDAFPVGQKLITSARLGLARAKVSMEKLEPFDAQIRQVISLAQFMSDSWLTCDEAHISNMKARSADLVKYFSDEFNQVLVEFMPNSNTPLVADLAHAVCEMVWNSLRRAMDAVIRRDVVLADVVAWQSKEVASSQRLLLAYDIITSFQGKFIFSTRPSYVNIRGMFSWLRWLEKCAQVLRPETDIDELKLLQKNRQQCMKHTFQTRDTGTVQFDASVKDVDANFKGFLTSPFMRPDGE